MSITSTLIFQSQFEKTKRGEYFSPCDLYRLKDRIFQNVETRKKNHKPHAFRVYNIPCAFDIETTSFRDEHGEKCAIMYEWTFGINGYVFIGRTWAEFADFCEGLKTILGLSETVVLPVYVQNFGFEFNFIRYRFGWQYVFSMDVRKPIEAVSVDGFMFRCSYYLSGYSLAKIGDNLIRYKVNKLVGDLNYNLMRHSETPMTYDELKYCINDVLVVMAFIQEKIEADGDITKIPLTKTGYVRRLCRQRCLPKDDKQQHHIYAMLMKKLQLTVEEYDQLQRAFAGGFTHANAYWVNKTLELVASFDFTSSYPAVMVAEKYPMGTGKLYEIRSLKDFYAMNDKYCTVFDITFYNLQDTFHYENYISLSKCYNVKNAITNNGRVVSADELTITITNVDFDIIEKVYKWTKCKIDNFRYYYKNYLPKPFIETILELYQKKTMLKDVEGKEAEYLNSKELLNSCYGMTVTNICRPEIVFENDEWCGLRYPDKQNVIDKYNHDFDRFLSYPWGVFITAFSRRRLWTGILELASDYLYSDTDSLKFIHPERHVEYFIRYNEEITRKLEIACASHGIDFAMTHPKTVKGVEKPLGVWDNETEKGLYKRFKTLGAKRYLVEDHKGEIKITVAGLAKKESVEYMKRKYKTTESIFRHFTNNLFIDSTGTGKLTHTYIDDDMSGTIVDYLGNTANYYECSSVHLEPCEYSLTLSSDFVNFLTGVNEYYR